MNRKNDRRLTLHRETLKQLDARQLEAALGAATDTCAATLRPACCTASNSCPPPPTGDCTTD